MPNENTMKKLILLFILCSLFTQHTFPQWYQQLLPVTKPITGIKFIDSLKGWAVTDSSPQYDTCYILHTTSGGINWFRQFQLDSSFFKCLNVIDQLYAYAGGYSFRLHENFLYKTTNGGLNWFNQGAPTEPDDLFFINRDSGWYCSSFIGPDVRTTTDGGQTWQLRINGMMAATRRLYFLNYNSGFCGANGYLYKTTNAGLSWIQQFDFGVENVYSIFFINEQNGWVGTGNRKIFYTSNGGTNWTEQVNPQYFSTINEIIMLNNLVGFAGSRNLRIYKTTNGGLLWGYQVDSAGSYRIAFVDSIRGWSGDFGVAHTTNGGGPISYVGIINNNNKIPNTYILYQNYPNPFNSQTVIKFSINKTSYVQLKIYDILGRENTIWKSEKLLSAGTHELSFDAGNYSSGVYFYQLTVFNEQSSVVYKESRKMVLIK